MLEEIVPRFDEIVLEEQNLEEVTHQSGDSRPLLPLAQSTPRDTTTNTVTTSTTTTTPLRRPLGSISTNIQPRQISKNASTKTVKIVNPKVTKVKRTLTEKKKAWANIQKGRPAPPQFSTVPQESLCHALQQNIIKNLDFNLESIKNYDDKVYYDTHIKISESDAVRVCLQTVLQSECENNEWQDFRRLRFSASSAYTIYCRKESVENSEFWICHFKKLMKEKNKEVWTMKRGLTDEPFARKCYEDVSGKKVHVLGAFAHPLIPHFACSGDGIVLSEGILIEIKSPELGIFQSANDYIFELDFIRKPKENSQPELRKAHKYFGQVQMSMALLSLRLCHLVVYSSFDDSIFIVEVPFDKEWVRGYFAKLSFIFFNYKLPLLRQEAALC